MQTTPKKGVVVVAQANGNIEIRIHEATFMDFIQSTTPSGKGWRTLIAVPKNTPTNSEATHTIFPIDPVRRLKIDGPDEIKGMRA